MRRLIEGIVAALIAALLFLAPAMAAPGSSPAPIAVAGPTAWTPTDQSGGSVSLGSVNATYTQIGNIVYVDFAVTYSSTANSNNAALSLPVAVPNQSYARVEAQLYNGGSVANTCARTNVGTSTINIVNCSTQGAITNATLSTVTISGLIIYPAS